MMMMVVRRSNCGEWEGYVRISKVQMRVMISIRKVGDFLL